MSGLDVEATVTALREGAVARLVTHDAVVVDGPDAFSYLQGQVSQDLAPLGVGDGAEALVLSPQGKLEQYARVVRTADARYVVEVERGNGDALYERLRRFKLRVKASLDQASLSVVEVRGPKAVPPSDLPDGAIVLPFAFADFVGYDLVGGAAAIPDGVQIGDERAFEAARVAAGVPRMGRELTDKTIPAEAGIVERTVSFSKGCYTGQELVARIDSRGNNVPRRLRHLKVDGLVAPDDVVVIGDREVGRVTSVAPVGGAPTVALAYLRREVDPPTDVVVRTAAGDVAGRAEALPASAV